jgi:hypothetical protein
MDHATIEADLSRYFVYRPKAAISQHGD